MTFYLEALMFAFILSTADFIAQNEPQEKLRKNKKLISFSAGVAISYIILNLFPEISFEAFSSGKTIFLYVLLGFISLNLVEQYVHKKAEKEKKVSLYHKSVNTVYFFIYNVLIGVVLAVFAYKGLAETLIFFIPFLLYIIFKILPQEFKFKNYISRIAYSMAAMFGALVGVNYISFVQPFFGQIISFITGTLLYSVIRDTLPNDEAERPLYFMLGALFYTIVILVSWKFYL